MMQNKVCQDAIFASVHTGDSIAGQLVGCQALGKQLIMIHSLLQ